jgi:hypothetical protein
MPDPCRLSALPIKPSLGIMEDRSGAITPWPAALDSTRLVLDEVDEHLTADVSGRQWTSVEH